MTDVLNAVAEVRAAEPGYSVADAYYRGEVGELFASPAVQRLLRDSGSQFRVNLARRPVDAVLDRMKIASVVVPDDEAATAFLSEHVWERNRLGRVARTVNRSALNHGDAYLMVWPADDDDPQGAGVSVLYSDPRTTRVFYDPERPGRKLYAAKVWTEGKGVDQVTRATLYYPERIERWVSRKGSRGRDEADFEPFIEDGEEWPAVNPVGEVPFIHFRTDEPYGRPEHADAFGPQNAITKLTALQMTTADFQGFPQRYALEEATSSSGAGADSAGVWDDDDTGERDDRLESGPGTVWSLVAKAVGQFPPADPDAFLKPLGVWVRMLAATTATPLRFFDPAGQIPSGEALRADEAPLAEKIQDRQSWLGDAWREALVLAMRVAGRPVVTVDVRWRPVQVVSDREGWDTVKAKQEAGVPARTSLMEAGYRPEVVDEWDRGSSQTNLETRLGALERVASAVVQLQSAAEAGVLNAAQLDQVLGQIVAEMVQTDPESGA